MDDQSFLGSVPPVPVQLNCQQCGEVRVVVKFVKEERDHDTLRKWAEVIDRMLVNGGMQGGCFQDRQRLAFFLPPMVYP